MKLVIPVSQTDVHLLDDTVRTFKALGGLPRHDVLFLPTHGCFDKAQIAADQLRYSVKSVKVAPWERDNVGIWPYPGNIMWQHACIEVSKQENAGDAQPWYYWELDNTPLSPGWLDKIESEYFMSGCKFMGAVVPTRQLIGNNQYTTERFIPGQAENIPHMVGTGVYPKDIGKETQGLWRFPKHDLSWDVYLRYQFNKSLHATKLIDHHWSTINYKEKNGVISCENDPKNPFGTDHSGDVSKDAVVVHGCKDGSLMKIVLSKYEQLNIPVQKQEEPEPEAAPAPAPNIAGVKYDRALDTSFKNSNTLKGVIVSQIEKKKRGRPRKNPEPALA